jgi:hypothetical protein
MRGLCFGKGETHVLAALSDNTNISNNSEKGETHAFAVFSDKRNISDNSEHTDLYFGDVINY